MTTELFLFLCKKSELTTYDMEEMTIGMCLDYMEEVIRQNKGESKKESRNATQSDFDAF